YNEIITNFKDEISKWDIPKDTTLLDVGAGTGNFSIELAKAFPHNNVIHMDFDENMNKLAKKKSLKENLSNFQTMTSNIEDLNLKHNSLSAITSVHAIYTFSNPKSVLMNLYNWLDKDGYVFLCDPGRVLDIRDWSVYLAKHLIKSYGIIKTIEIFWKGREISKQNRNIREMQLKGKYWVHTHEEFCNSVTEAGFKIVSSYKCFRGVSDVVVARKYPV
ncbi:MAG: methyltransferase domain-containing protein, partial [Nitrospirae bacterium]|nr:methyltransferase domain-containing protein [Nitrospirota bacterium]